MNTTNCGKPSIIVRQTDHARLTSLALAAAGRDPCHLSARISGVPGRVNANR